MSNTLSEKEQLKHKVHKEQREALEYDKKLTELRSRMQYLRDTLYQIQHTAAEFKITGPHHSCGGLAPLEICLEPTIESMDKLHKALQDVEHAKRLYFSELIAFHNYEVTLLNS